MFSLVITTQGKRIDELVRLFDSLSRQKEEFEVILVDQSSGNEVKAILYKYKFHKKYVYIGKAVSLSRARNIGLEFVEGEYVAFPDDDCWYPDNLLEQIIEKFNESSADVICINTFDPFLNKPLLKRQAKKDVIKISQLNVMKYPISIGIFSKKNNIRFDEELGVGTKWGACEESDYILRILKENKKIVYYKNLQAYHLYINENDTASLEMKSYKYGQGYGALIKKACKRGQYSIILDYCITILRSLGGILFYKLRGKNNYRKYYMRVAGMIYGLINS